MILPALLHLPPVGFGHPSVIMPSLDMVLISQLLGDLLALVTRTAVDDATRVGALCVDKADDLFHQVLDLGSDFIVEVGAVEGLLELFAALDT